LPSFKYVTGLPEFRFELAAYIEACPVAMHEVRRPSALSTPAALAGPGVSRPTTASSS
jgi:hypothetical protein